MRFIFICISILLFLGKQTFSQAKIGYSGSLCEDAEINFIDLSPSADSWLWNFGDGTSSTEQNPTHAYQDTGNYLVTLSITSSGNNSSKSQNFYISQNPVAYFIVDSTSVSYSSYSRLFIDSSTFYNTAKKYSWDFGDVTNYTTDSAQFLYKYSDAGSYTVWHKVTDNRGCTDSSSQMVVINDIYFVPNVFSPNNDLINDQFIITSNGVTLFTVDIFSRWGNRVFTRTGTEQILWDGRLPNGTMVQPGTYYYVITSESGNIIYEPETGFITVFY